MQPVANIGGGGSQAADVQFVINGPDLKKLEQVSTQLLARTKSIPGVVDADTSLNVGKPEWSVQIDRAEGRGSRRPDIATRPRRSACSSAAIR